MSSQNFNISAEQEESIDIKRFITKIILRWPLILLCVIIAFTISYIVNRYAESVYSVRTTIMIIDEKKTSAEMLMPSLDRFNSRKNVENEISILRSYSLARKTIDELDFKISYSVIGRVRESKIYKPTFFKIQLDSINPTKTNYPIYITILNGDKCLVEIDNTYDIKKTLKSGEYFHHPDFNFAVIINKNAYSQSSGILNDLKYQFYVNDLNSLASLYQGKLNISANEKRSTILDISTSGPLPDQDVDYLNKLCQVYIRRNLEEKNIASTNTIKFIDMQLHQISDSLRKAENRLQNFRLNNKLLDLTDAGATISKKLDEYQSQRLLFDMRLKYVKYIKTYINSKTDFNDIIAPSVMGIEDPMLNSLIKDLVELYKQKSILLLNAPADNPSISMVGLKMKKTIELLNENTDQNINSINLEIKELNDKAKQEEIDFQKIPITEREFINIKRDYDLNNNIFTFLLQKRAESGISKASNVADSKVLDYATKEGASQISPDKSKNLIVALLLGFLIPVIYIFIMELLNNRITDIRDLEKSKKCSVIGSVGHNRRNSDLPVFENPKSSLAESFRALRTNLQYLLREKDDKTILITSTISGEGKTFCSINLAAILAMSNKRTLLMGLDLRKPRIHKLFNLPNDIGLSTFLINLNTKSEIILETNISNLFIVPSGPIPPNPAELLETVEMENLMAELKTEFDYIILDTPPVAIVTDAMLLSKFSNTNIFVIRQDFSSKDVLKLADELAEKEGIKKLNILVNDVRIPGYYGYTPYYKNNYGYKYGYGYSYYGRGSDYYSDSGTPTTFREKLKHWFGAS